jgi:hypothetical protein
MAQFNAIAEGLPMAGNRVQVLLYTDSAAAGALNGEGSTQTFFYERENAQEKFQLAKRTLDVLRSDKNQSVVVPAPVEKPLENLFWGKRDEVTFGKQEKQRAKCDKHPFQFCWCDGSKDPLTSPKPFEQVRTCVEPTPTCTCKIYPCDGQCEAKRKSAAKTPTMEMPMSRVRPQGEIPPNPYGVRDCRGVFERLELKRKQQEADTFVAGVAPAPMNGSQPSIGWNGVVDLQPKAKQQDTKVTQVEGGIKFEVEKNST